MAIRGPPRDWEPRRHDRSCAARRADAADRGQKAEQRHAHGVAWVDDYAWIRADNWREVLRDPAALPADIRALLEAENAYADAVLAPTRALQRQLVREMRARLKEDDSEVPQSDGPYAYYSRFRHGGQHRIFCRKPRGGGKETILIDGDARAEGKGFFHLVARPLVARPSPARLERRRQGLGDVRDPRARPRAARRTLPIASRTPPAKRCGPPNSQGFLYVEQDEDHRPWRVMLHRLATPQSEDVADLRGGRSGLFHRHPRRASRPRGDDLGPRPRFVGDACRRPRRSRRRPRLIAPRRPGFRYEAMDHGDVFYIRANSGGAADFQIVVAPREAPEEANWRPFVPHKPGRLIERATLFKDFLVLLAREDNVPHLVVHALADGERA